MKARKVCLTFFLVAIGLAFLLQAGCAKKEVIKEEAPMEKQAAMETQAPAPAPAPAQPSQDAEKEKLMAEQAAREKAAAEEAARAEQAAKEKAAAEEAAKVEKEASGFRDIHFDFDSYNIGPGDREILNMLVKWLIEYPKYFVRIEGNCDERGSIEYNLALGQRRADEAMRYLVNIGIDKSRISTVSYGKEHPLDPGHNDDAWAKNRRDHFVLTQNK
jgi:peptidoglycan-associated lipoprotein